VHSVVFGGFSADSIRDRIADSGATALITADGSYRRGTIVPLKNNVDRAGAIIRAGRSHIVHALDAVNLLLKRNRYG